MSKCIDNLEISINNIVGVAFFEVRKMNLEMTELSKCHDQLFTIGEVSKICKISKKALRIYEQMGIVIPDKVSKDNGYRYYNRETMMLIPVIKYYKQMGFKLQEMKGVGDKKSYFYHENNFISKLDELKNEEMRIKCSYRAVDDWLNMLREGFMVLDNNIQNVNVKYLEKANCYFKEQPFNYNYMESVINIPWVNYLEEHDCEITGPMILKYPSYKAKKDFKEDTVFILQEPVGRFTDKIGCTEMGGTMALCSYHIGDPRNIEQKYEQIEKWAKENQYICGPEAYERFVIDYWATNELDKFVTEVIIPVEKEKF